MRKPTSKPSTRLAERSAKAASMRPDVTRMLNHFPLDDKDSWRVAEVTRLANQRIDELVRYIGAINGGYMVLALLDMRGERDVLMQLIRDMRRALEGADDLDDSNGRESHEERVARLIEAASKITDTSRFTSEQRLRCKPIAFS